MKWTGEKIYERSRQWARVYSMRLGAAHIEDELAQEAALGIIRGLETFDPTKGNEAYIRDWALSYMRKHAQALSLVVRRQRADRSKKYTVVHALISAESAPQPNAARDTRAELPAGPAVVEFREAWARADELTRKAVENHAMGETHTDLANQLGFSREYIRKKFSSFGRTPEENRAARDRINAHVKKHRENLMATCTPEELEALRAKDRERARRNREKKATVRP